MCGWADFFISCLRPCLTPFTVMGPLHPPFVQQLENYDISFFMQVAASVLAGIASCLACCTCCVGGSGWGPGKKKSKDDDGPYGTDNELDET